MAPPEPEAPAASVSLGELEVVVWVTEKGVSRLLLPEGLAGLEAKDVGELRLTTKRELDRSEDRHLYETVELLNAVLSAEEPLKMPLADLSGLSSFTAAVLEETRKIPWGEVRSYGWIASRVGSSGGARAVGGALGRNPVPLVVPCHRVVRTDGTLGGFGLGTGFKRWLLRQEGPV